MRLFAVLPLLFCTALSAQTLTDNYIELTVKDTIPMRTKRITYVFTPQATEMSADAVYEDNDDWEKLQRKVEQEAKQHREKLLKSLVKEGFKATEGSGDEGYSISSYEDASSNMGVQVEVANEAELKRLVTFLRSTGKGDGYVNGWEYEPTSESDVEVMKRLYNKAAAQAGTIATLGGRKLGKLLSAHGPDEGIAGHSLLDLIAEIGRREMMKGDHGTMPDFFMGREKTLVFRFALD